MKTAILISLLLHSAVILTALRTGEDAVYPTENLPAVYYLGSLENDLFPAVLRRPPEKPPPRYSGFKPPEAKASIIGPREIQYEEEWTPAEPELTFKEIKALSEKIKTGRGVSFLEEALKNIGPPAIPCEEKIRP